MTSSRFLPSRWLALGLLAAYSAPFAGAAATTPAAAPVTMTMNGQPAKVGDYVPADVKSLVLDNGVLKITFGPDKIGDFSATSVIIKNTELAGNLNGVQPRDQNAQRTFYHDFAGSNGILRANQIKIIQNTPELVHFAILGNTNPSLEDHYVMLPGESGIHPYVIIYGNSGGEMRTMYRFDMNLLDWTWTPERTGQQKSYSYLQSISTAGNMGDETWRLPDGSIYTKYDWCLYYAEAPMWGHYGHGFGAWFIPVSNESYAGGPLRQDLAVHQDALILNYIGGGHLGSSGPAGGRNGEKLHGPWFVYFNSGPTPEAIIADAEKTALAEQKKWPYMWVDERLYPTKRTTVTGQLVISHDRSAANAYVVLAQPGNAGGGGGRGGRGGRAGGAAPAAPADAPAPAAAIENFSSQRVFGQVAATPDAPADAAPAAPAAGGARRGGGGRGGRGGAAAAQAGPAVGTGGTVTDRASIIANQGGDFIYYVKADANGKFTLPAVRPGTYTLYAWQNQGSITESFAKDGVVIQGEKEDLGKIAWDATYHPNLLMQIGKADRMAGEFKFGNGPREYEWMSQVPNNLTFTVGKSKELEDWYYAQKGGVWTVNFNVTKPVTGNAYLTIAVAGGTGNVQFALNGQNVGSISYNDDGSVRRQANRSGRYGLDEFTFPASLLKQGENTLTLTNTSSAGGNNGLMYDTIVLESD